MKWSNLFFQVYSATRACSLQQTFQRANLSTQLLISDHTGNGKFVECWLYCSCKSHNDAAKERKEINASFSVHFCHCWKCFMKKKKNRFLRLMIVLLCCPLWFIPKMSSFNQKLALSKRKKERKWAFCQQDFQFVMFDINYRNSLLDVYVM